MPVIKRKVSAASENVLTDRRFANLKGPALVSLWATTATAGEVLSFGVGDLLVAEACAINLEVANEVVDTNRDQILWREPVASGQLTLAVPAVAADMSYILLIEAL